MKNIILAAGLCGGLCAGAAHAGTPDRLRGHVVAISPHQMTVLTYSGAKEVVALTAATRFTTAAPAKLSSLRPGEFIGAGAVQDGNHLDAEEVTILPESMRGAGEGHYPWSNGMADEKPGGSMTNGNVMSAMPAGAGKTSMTNGNVARAAGEAGNERLVVTYKGGQQTILVSPTIPIDRIAPATEAAVTQGAAVFVVAVPGANGLTARFVVVATDGARLGM